MKHTKSIKKNSAFRLIYAKGISSAGRLLVLYSAANGTESNSLGVTVGKKVGGAVVRNRVKRLVKESYRLAEGRIARGYDFVVVARAAAGKSERGGSFAAIERALISLLAKQGFILK